MAMSQIHDLLTDKLKLDDENKRFEAVIQGKGQSEPELKAA